MLLGNIALVISAVLISQSVAPFSGADIVFWGAVVIVVWLRHIDIARFHGETVTGAPANMSHWRRYAIGMLVLALVLWGVAHLIAWRTSAA